MKILTCLVLAMLLASPADAWAFAKKPKPAPSPSMAAPKYACPMFCEFADTPGKCQKCGMEMGEVSY